LFQPPARRTGLGTWGAIPGIAFLLILLAATDATSRADDLLAGGVVLLANSEDADSLRIARHYAAVRGVPTENILALRLPQAESITWREFVVSLWEPLMEQLVSRGWIDAIPMALTDPVGRRKHATSGHRISALVICRGVPLKITHDPGLYGEALPFTSRGEFRTNGGAVDSELSLLAQPNYPINAFVPNPLFRDERPTSFERMRVVKVARLDGPTAADALGLVDQAMAAEKGGLFGRAYVDIGDRDPVGNSWLESVARQLDDLGFDLSVDREPGTITPAARMDAPVLYFGWYAADLEGPFALPGFRFPPGAIALHIHSYSAATLRSTTGGWAGPFVARGVAATVGNVEEPYLQFTHRPDLLLRALARGQTLAEAAYFALVALSWQTILIGDPLYRPFAVPFEEQFRRRAETSPRLAGYAVMRRMRQLDNMGRAAEATALAVSAQRDAPSLVVGVALAQRLRAAGDLEAAASAVGFVPMLRVYRPDEWAVAREAALVLEACGRPARSIEVWRILFAIPELPAELRMAWLGDARDAALAVKDAGQAAAWERERDELAAKGRIPTSP